MKRDNLTTELYCQSCNYLNFSDKFTFVDDNIAVCSQCGSRNVIIAKAVSWCNVCGQKPRKGDGEFALCIDCENRMVN